VHIIERVTMAELIADCAAIPVPQRPADQAFYPLHVAEPWQVDDACYAQVRELDEYV
jgi:hypothetical protein